MTAPRPDSARTTPPELREQLDHARQAFRASIAALGAPEVWTSFSGNVAAVLAGGGARGAYEAGALLAFQDAQLPTPLITASSIGSVNGASYAAYARGAVGDAEPLLGAWLDLTPPTVGVEWTRYAWMIVGLLATFAGVVNLTYFLLTNNGYEIHLHHPAIAWISLSLAGLSVLLFYEDLPYFYHVVRRLWHRSPWRPSLRRTANSIGANLLVLAFGVALIESLDVHTEFGELIYGRPLLIVVIMLGLFMLRWVRQLLHPWIGKFWGRLLRLPFRTGIFSNFERTRFLRGFIPGDRLRESAVHVVLAVTDLERGVPRFFTNADPASFLGKSGVDVRFAKHELIRMDDPMPAVIASSALPIAYEPLELDDRLHGDGSIMASQPIRPAIRLGADVLLLVSMENSGMVKPATRTFVDIGLRALDILIQQNVKKDVALLMQANRQIEEAAASLGERPEDLAIEFEGRRFRYVKVYAIHPTVPIAGTILDFGGRATGETILAGYRDATVCLESFARYARTGGFRAERRTLHMRLAMPGA